MPSRPLKETLPERYSTSSHSRKRRCSRRGPWRSPWGAAPAAAGPRPPTPRSRSSGPAWGWRGRCPAGSRPPDSSPARGEAGSELISVVLVN